MRNSIYRITLDMHDVASQVQITAKQHDTARKLHITLSENGSPYTIEEGCRAVLTINRSGSTVIIDDCEIKLNGSVIMYDFNSQTTEVLGINECEVKLYDPDGDIITSPRFTLLVDENVYNDGEDHGIDHRNVLNRDKEDQHPIKAITGLEKELESKANAEKIYAEIALDRSRIDNIAALGQNSVIEVQKKYNTTGDTTPLTFSLDNDGKCVVIIYYYKSAPNTETYSSSVLVNSQSIFTKTLDGAAGTYLEEVEFDGKAGDIVTITRDNVNVSINSVLYVTNKSTDTELADIGLGADGTIYPCDGDAVREQYSALKDDVDSQVGALKGDLSQLSEEIVENKAFINNVMEVTCNIANPNDVVENKYWAEANKTTDMDNWQIIEVEVDPNKTYSIYGTSPSFCWFVDVDRKSLGKISELFNNNSNGDITTPEHCKYLHLTKRTGKEFVVINKAGYSNRDNKGYLQPIETEIPSLKNVSVSAEDTYISNTLVKDIYDYKNVGGTVTNFENGVLTQEFSGDGNKWWYIPFSSSEITSNFVLLKTKIESLIGSVGVLLQAYNTNGELKYLSVTNISSAGEHDILIDLNYYVVYHNADLSRNLAILFSNRSSELTAVYSRADIYDRITMLDTEKNLLENLNNMSTDITSAKAMAQSATSNIKLLGSDGEKYYLQVSNGQLAVSPVIPSNILYIGNSLLIGWGTFGMASSNSSEDYYAYVNAYLTEQGKTVTASKMSGVTFEGCTTIEAQNTWMNGTLLPKLNSNLDLVIIQLGDNVNTDGKLAVFEEGAKNLVSFIRQHAPNARVAWVGEWYSSATKQMYIANACASYGAVFVDISDLPKVSGNTANIGDIVTKDDGTTITIDSSGVASHPSSQGMRAIANRIIETLF